MLIDPALVFSANENRISSVNSSSKYDIADVTAISEQGKENQGFSVSKEDTVTISIVKIGDNPYYGVESSPTEDNIVLDTAGNVSKEAIVQRSENPYYEEE